MRILALDIGDKRTGVAISDETQRISSPVTVLDTSELMRNGSKLRGLFEDYEVEMTVVGLPLTLAGEEGPQARHVRALVAKLIAAASLPAFSAENIVFFDERLSSKEAEASLALQGLSERDQRGKIDMIAASLFLQTYLDSQKETS